MGETKYANEAVAELSSADGLRGRGNCRIVYNGDRIAPVPAIFGGADFLDRGFARERGKRRAISHRIGHGGNSCFLEAGEVVVLTCLANG